MDERIEETTDLTVVHELRRAILRTGALEGLPVGSSHDGEPEARHWVAWAAADDGSGADAPTAPVAVCSIVPDDGPFGPGSARLTGMGVADGRRGTGLGGRLLVRALADADRRWGLVWAHARVPAVAFYERFGFEARGRPYDHLPGVPHRLIVRPAPVPPPPAAG